jgi:uncharacterized protein
MKGKLVHMELPADDTGRAKQFWGQLAGWQFQTFDGPVEYNMFEGEPGGGIYPRQQGERGPVVYFETDDIDAELERVRELGGSAEEKQPIPGMGWYAHCKDTEDNSFSLFQSDQSVPAPT